MIWCAITLAAGCLVLGLWVVFLARQADYWQATAETENGKVRRHADTIKRLSLELETEKRKLGLDALKAQYGIQALQAVAKVAQEHIREIHARFDPQTDEDPDE